MRLRRINRAVDVLLSVRDVQRGGLEQVLRDLIIELPRRRIRASLILTGSERTANDAAVLVGIPEAAVEIVDLTLSTARGIRKLHLFYKFYRGRSERVVNIHCSSPMGIAVIESLAVRLAGKQVVLSFHGIDNSTNWGLRRRLFVRFGFALANRIIVTSESMRRHLRDWGFRGRSVVIYLGVRRLALRDRLESRLQLGVPNDAFLIAHFARMVPEKGLGDLARVAASLLAEHPSVFVVAAGASSPHALDLCTHLKSAIPQRSKCLIDLEDPSGLYSAADLFVLPSKSEGYGLVFREAAQFGVPSIAYSVGGVSEAVIAGRTGILVPYNDFNALREAVLLCITRPSYRRELGRNAKELSKTSSTSSSMVSRYARVFSFLKGDQAMDLEFVSPVT